MKKLKLKSQSKLSGQIIVVLIIVLGLVGVGFWWLFSNKQEMATEGKAFAREAVQRIVVQRDANFFSSHLSPAARTNFPPSVQQEVFAEIARLGAPVGPIDVQGKIEFQSQFFEPHGDFRARINYPANYADINLSVSHPVGRWQIDELSFLPQRMP
ncbi:MAG: hypothetical protein DME76_15675 [Verrucomicrobia bacterium]|nr:MAG: hypothetical protein DME76_15675 [Verrucomicrobiota bacterium]